MRVTKAIAMMGGLAVGGHAAAKGLIKNGGFEKPGPTQNGYTVVPAGNHIPGWAVVGPQGGNILLLSDKYTENGGALHFSPHGGHQSVDLTGVSNQGAVGLQQKAGTVRGKSYTLTFWLGNQYDGAPNYTLPSSATLYVDGVAVNTYATDMNTLDDVTWQQFTYQFVAKSSHTLISFVNATPSGDNYCGLDDVSLTTP